MLVCSRYFAETIEDRSMSGTMHEAFSPKKYPDVYEWVMESWCPCSRKFLFTSSCRSRELAVKVADMNAKTGCLYRSYNNSTGEIYWPEGVQVRAQRIMEQDGRWVWLQRWGRSFGPKIGFFV